MKTMKSSGSFMAFFACASLLSFLLQPADAEGLKVHFYERTCPRAEAIVRRTVADFVAEDATVSAPLLRLHFHDCFVRGCDGSVLLDSTRGHPAEKDAKINLSLDGFDVIDAAKAALEAACPGVVSCADIVALAARDGVVLNDGPSWAVETGRRDGHVSKASEPPHELPLPSMDIGAQKENFARKGLNSEDLVLLSGAHTIGASHCSAFSDRLYNFTGHGDADPSLNHAYARTLRKECKPGDEETVVDMDPGSAVNFDNSYYRGLIAGKGLLVSDEALLHDKVTRSFVQEFIHDSPDFFRDFGAAMVKMGRIGVLTGRQGEIRRHCALVNSWERTRERDS